MDEGKLKTAILGLNEDGRLLLEAAEDVGCLHIHAVADKDANLAERVAGEHNCTAYDDYRQLVIQNDLDCLLVAEAIHSCEEYVRMAIKKGFSVLKLAPPARNFEEAAQFVKLAEEKHVRFAIANPRRFARSFLALRQFLEAGKIEEVFLITAFCNASGYEPPGWQGDPKLSGGGVLIHNCYKMIDQITSNFRMPEQVYALSTNQAPDKQQRLYLAEDTAVVTMKLNTACMANLVCSRRAGIGPATESLTLYGRQRTLTVNDTELILQDQTGDRIEHLRYDDDERARTGELLWDFARSVLSPDRNRLRSSGRENLANMAVIEAAYLSARTGFPEEPARILQMASPPGEEAEDAWAPGRRATGKAFDKSPPSQ